MRTLFLLAVLVPAFGLPAAASQQLSIPQFVNLRLAQTNLYRLQAFTPRRKLEITANGCFASPGRAEDVVRAVHEGMSSGSSGTVLSIDIRPHNTGTCAVRFSNGLESATTTITVSK
jgi:hypothetical protein